LDAGGGCVTVQPVNVVVNSLDDATFTMTPTCDGGTATVSGTPGGVFTFDVAPGDAAIIDAGSGTVSGGTTGNSYDVLYTTTGACPASLVVSVTSVSTVTYSAVISDENCGAGDGQIVLTGAGGDGGPYQYSITGGAPYFASGTFAALSAASYNVSVLDNSGCEVTGTESVSGTGGPTIDNITPTDPTCAGVCDGSITVSVSGGTPPYSYQWYDNLGNPVGVDSPTLSGVCEGDYSVEVNDASGAPVQLFYEDFETGAPTWNLNAVMAVEGADPNFFAINDNEGGVLPPGCGLGGNGNQTLHITSVWNPAGGAAYDAGGGCGFLFCPETHRQSETPLINTVLQTGLTLNFDFIANGDIPNDQGTVWYNDGFGWTQLGGALFSGTGACAPQGVWTAFSSPLPVSCENIANLQIAIRWDNNDDGLGSDPSLAINNLEIVTLAGGCPSVANSTLVDPPAPVLMITDPVAVCSPGTVDLTAAAVTAGSDPGTITYWLNALATVPMATPNAVNASNTYYIQLDVAGCKIVEPVNVTVNPLDDASFTSSDFCASAVNIISGVATPGGVYSIQSQTGSGLATITPGTGILANYVAGDQIIIEYTTAGLCPNTSTQVVNVINLDNASFTSSDFCVSSVNIISGVASPGGVYSIQSQTGSGLVTITPSTGILANYVAGDQITIEYTTAGACPNTSTQVVNVTNLDDASFTSTDFCVSAVNIISGVATPGGVYSIQSQTGSGLVTITPGTGVLANYVVGDQITIEYTTTGACPNTSTQVVNVTNLDDASFTSSDFCSSSVNIISGVATPGGVYTIQSQTGSGLVTITAGTGILANYVAGDQVTIEYTTAGACPNTSTQVVNVTNLDDASFTSSDFCESAVNIILGVATPGGVYSISAQTGTATINPNSGVLANFVAGDQITIEYTTPVGACQSTSSQIVNVIASDDGTFTMTPTCDGGTATVTGLPGGAFTFTNPPGDAANIDGLSGTVSAGTNSSTYDITYTTNGACPVSVQQQVVALNIDDASFTLTPTCDGGSATVTGLGGGTFTFSPLPGDGASIDGVTGLIVDGLLGTTYNVMYLTNGVCPNSSTEIVMPIDCTTLSDIVIPTAITPGTDGINDTWEIQDLDLNYPDNSVRVYNRWGNLVFEHNSSVLNPYSNNRWDGTYNGDDLPVASYYYIIEFNDESNGSETGIVSIIIN